MRRRIVGLAVAGICGLGLLVPASAQAGDATNLQVSKRKAPCVWVDAWAVCIHLPKL